MAILNGSLGCTVAQTVCCRRRRLSLEYCARLDLIPAVATATSVLCRAVTRGVGGIRIITNVQEIGLGHK